VTNKHAWYYGFSSAGYGLLGIEQFVQGSATAGLVYLGLTLGAGYAAKQLSWTARACPEQPDTQTPEDRNNATPSGSDQQNIQSCASSETVGI
jgi:hypothetical protein